MGYHRPELDGRNRNVMERWRTNWKLRYRTRSRARLTPTLTHVVAYELATSGAEDDAMSSLPI